MAPRTADSRHLQHPFQLPDHDVAVHLDVTTSQPAGAQERTLTEIPQAGLDDTGTDRSRDGCLERLGAKKADEEAQQVHAK